MRLYLVRHGEATSPEVNAARPLSEAGERQIRRLSGFVKPLELAPAEVWHSGKARAEGTARILLPALAAGEPLGTSSLIEKQNLAPNDPVAPVAGDIEAIGEDLMIVGHLPFVSRLTSLLILGQESPELVVFGAGAIACLERDDGDTWSLMWTVSPEILPDIVE